MTPPFRAAQTIVIAAPLETVWRFNMDLGRIADFHPRVTKVDLISGVSERGPGVAYQCHLADGKNTCIERDIEVVPMEKVVTLLASDTFGLTKILSDYRVETVLQSAAPATTRITISHYYSTPTIQAKVVDLIARRRIARETHALLRAMKSTIENL